MLVPSILRHRSHTTPGSDFSLNRSLTVTLSATLISAGQEWVRLYKILATTGVACRVPKNSIMDYETALKFDQFLVMAHGMAAEMAKAKSILETPVQHKSPPIKGER